VGEVISDRCVRDAAGNGDVVFTFAPRGKDLSRY